MKILCNDIVIGDDCFEEAGAGWFTSDTIETEEEMVERIKVLLKELREFARTHPDETVLMISHDCFLRALLLLLTNQHETFLDSKFMASNNSLTIVDFEINE